MGCLLDPAVAHRLAELAGHPVELRDRHRLPAQAGHERGDQRAVVIGLIERGRHVQGEDAAVAGSAEAQVGLHHPDRLDAAQRRPQVVAGERPDPEQPGHADLDALLAQPPDRGPAGDRVTAGDDQRDLGVVEQVLLDEVRVAPAEGGRELVGLLPDDGDRVLHRAGPLQLQRRSLLGVDLRAV